MAVDLRGFAPDPARNIQAGANFVGGLFNQAAKTRNQRNQDQLRALSGQVLSGGTGADVAKQQLQQQFPEQSLNLEKQIAERAKLALQNKTAEEKADLERFIMTNAKAMSLPENQRGKFFRENSLKVSGAGGDGSDSLEIADLFESNPELANKQINDTIRLGQLTGTLGELKTDIAKFGLDDLDTVKSSKINEDGSATIVTKGGKLKTISPDELGAQIIANANAVGIDVQGKRSQARELGKDAAKGSSEAIQQASMLRGNNAILRQVIDEVRGGAETGPLAAKLPSFRAESVRLDQLRNKLGLDVVGSVTFGALSEGELQLAMSTALPTKLNGPELIQWADDKIFAQEKLAAYLEDQAIFLGKSGNKQADWLEMQKLKSQKRKLPEVDVPQKNSEAVDLSQLSLEDLIKLRNEVK